MNDPIRVPLALLPQHLDYIVNLLGTANLRYVDTAPILQDIQHQVIEHAQQKPNGSIEQPEAAGALQ